MLVGIFVFNNRIEAALVITDDSAVACGVVDDGGRLEYEITSTDPETFSEPLTLTKSFFWVPGLELLPYECSEA